MYRSGDLWVLVLSWNGYLEWSITYMVGADVRDASLYQHYLSQLELSPYITITESLCHSERGRGTKR